MKVAIKSASKKKKTTDEYETSQREETFHIEKKVAREIQEDANGTKTVREVETSTSNNKSRSTTQILRHKELAKATIEYLNLKDPMLIMNRSQYARKRFQDLDVEKCGFLTKFPKFHLSTATPEMYTEALQTYMAAVFVDYTWEEIMNCDGTFRLIDFENIMVNKLVWNAAFSADTKEDPELFKIVNDSSGSIKLLNFDITNRTASIKLTVGSFELALTLKHVDPFLLLLIPDKMSQARVRTHTRCLANDVLDEPDE